MNKNLKICFYMPSRITGGCEFLFCRLAEFLDEKCGIEVFYFDYEDGFAQTLLKNTKVKFIKYNPKQNKYKICDNLIIITPLTLLFRIPKIENKNVKILPWNLHVENINWLRNSINYNFIKTQNLIKFLSDKKGIINQDLGPYATAKKYYPDVIKNYLPTLLSDITYKIKTKLKNDNELNIGYLSRLDEDKIYSLINLLDNLKNYKTDKKIKIHIIGEGESKNKINIERYSQFAELIFVGKIIKEDLENYLENNVDILFAMGTSMLEAERLAIPSVMTFYSDKEFYNNEFVFAHDLPECLSGCRLQFNETLLKRQTIQEILDTYIQNIELFSKMSREHFEKDFVIDNKINNLIEYCQRCNLYQEDLLKITLNKENKSKKTIFDEMQLIINKTTRTVYKLQKKSQNKKFLIFVSTYSYFRDMRQRANHLFELFIKDGYTILWSDSNINKIIEVEQDIFLFPLKDSKKLIFNNKIKNKTVMSISTHYTSRLLENMLIKAAKRNIPVIFEHLDDIDLISNKRKKKELETRFSKICATKDILITTTADNLYAQACEKRGNNTNIILVPNGVNLNDFSSKRMNAKFLNFVEKGAPIIGYYGCITSAWFDFELLEHAIINNPNYNFVIIGPHNPKEVAILEKYSNFLCIDRLSYEQLKDYSKHFTVGIIPFKLNNITKSTSPCKLFEYMALNCSIVTTNLRECTKYKSCLIAHNKTEFSDLLKKAIIMRDDKNYLQILKEEAEANSYEKTYATISANI